MTAYAELQTLTNFTFLRGASHPQELALAAAALGMAAIAITDRNTLAGVVRAHAAAKEAGVRFIVGARLDLHDAPSLLAYPDRPRRLWPAVAPAHPRPPPRAEGRVPSDARRRHGPWRGADLHRAAAGGRSRRNSRARFPRSPPPFRAASISPRIVSIAATTRRRLAQLAELASRCGAPLVATNDVQYHEPARRPLQDVLTCIREHCTIDDAGCRLAANAERHLKSPDGDGAAVRRLSRGRRPHASRSPSAAASPSTSCATNIPTS